jgi:hypothetical protein
MASDQCAAFVWSMAGVVLARLKHDAPVRAIA